MVYTIRKLYLCRPKEMLEKTPITVAYGDGIGPEIMEATLKILDAANANLHYDVIEIGEKVYTRGISSGIEDISWSNLRANKVFLKAPITTPQGGGYKSLNVTTRKTLSLYANVRPCRALAPYVQTSFPKMNLVIVRENEEDLYAGIEHRQTQDVYQCLKLISRQGCERIIRYAFEYAVANNRKKVTAFSKDNIMKLTDGLFHKVYNEIALEYPQIQADHYIIDIGSAFLADDPERFDVIVTLNLYGDIVSDIAAQVAGSVGMGGSSNVGNTCAMFEAIHGSAPDIAGKGIANPSGLINGAIMMLVHLNKADIANKIENAWLKTLEDGIHTGDVYKEGMSTKKVGTQEFADAVIARLGQMPSHFAPACYANTKGDVKTVPTSATKVVNKELVGVDVFIDWATTNAQEVGEKVETLETQKLKFVSLTNRGLKVYPKYLPEAQNSDQWRCQYYTKNEQAISHADVLELLSKFQNAGLDFIKTEHLYTFDGKPGFSLAQGE